MGKKFDVYWLRYLIRDEGGKFPELFLPPEKNFVLDISTVATEAL